jgi:recombination protein RecA
MERRLPSSRRESGGGLYKLKGEPSLNLQLISSGSTLLDLTLSGSGRGAWPLGRMSNVIGDNSTGKTLLAIEACANFARQFPKGKIYYRESEAAFDTDYAQHVGLPLSRVDFGPDGIESEWNTIEDIFEDLSEKVKGKRTPKLYIVDSLDALSDRAELKRKIDEGSYAMGKQKRLHQLFRQRIREIKHSNMHLMIISQSRIKIGVMFGEKTTVNGDGALQYYASQRIKLAKIRTIKVKNHGMDRAVGVRIKARVMKNKVSGHYNDNEFGVRFAFGINDTASCLEFLIATGKYRLLEEKMSKERAKKLLEWLENLDEVAHKDWGDHIKKITISAWPAIQAETLPKWSKYETEQT